MYPKPISTSIALTLGHASAHPKCPKTTYCFRYAQHWSNPVLTLRHFHTARIHQATYRRFGDQDSKPTWSLIPSSPNGSYQRWPSNNQNYYGLPPWVWLLGIAGCGGYYLNHLEKVELTGRWRFMDTSVEAEIAASKCICKH